MNTKNTKQAATEEIAFLQWLLYMQIPSNKNGEPFSPSFIQRDRRNPTFYVFANRLTFIGIEYRFNSVENSEVKAAISSHSAAVWIAIKF